MATKRKTVTDAPKTEMKYVAVDHENVSSGLFDTPTKAVIDLCDRRGYEVREAPDHEVVVYEVTRSFKISAVDSDPKISFVDYTPARKKKGWNR